MKKHTGRIKALLLGCICAVTSAFSTIPAVADTIVPPIQGNTSSVSGTAPLVSGTAELNIPTLWVAGDSTAAAVNDTN